jgi:hypothetical protein
MKKIITASMLLFFMMTTMAAENQVPTILVKEVCEDKVNAKGQVVKNKDGKPVQECKKIKVYKKLEGTLVFEKK